MSRLLQVRDQLLYDLFLNRKIEKPRKRAVTNSSKTRSINFVLGESTVLGTSPGALLGIFSILTFNGSIFPLARKIRRWQQLFRVIHRTTSRDALELVHMECPK